MLTITFHPSDLDAFRAMLREQLAGDHEYLLDLQAGASVRAHSRGLRGGADPGARRLVERLAEAVGGLY